ncbi:glycosyltransferase [Rhodobacter veldkampii DSM 11550]|uniref:Glycosyltransferase n=1 Tax=Phaeovulum veldkampii DSM 11550 TaxID=1185920 RepID=A0A2T4JGE8_9RHOB|nr:glycosyltransferase family 2 protein [Phaeovulum veldkampii]MBK5947533.1 glycosyltransferase [Phaeovulum veldkampii DSM 11550]PTE16982.1 glycosyltransferase [Phaeovulum veldkampii DSM 11550]
MSSSPNAPDGAKARPVQRAAPSLSIVVPCFNEEAALPALLARLDRLVADLSAAGRVAGPVEVILVDDGSSDRTWQVICAASRAHRVTGLRLSRNHGHQRALLAGLMQASSDVVVSMDADLQDDPGVVAQMLDAYRDGAEIVYGVRKSRAADTAFKRFSARSYYWLMRKMGVDLLPDHADFRLISRKALRALGEFGETNLFLRGLIRQLGFASAVVGYDRAPRSAGESKYPLRKMLSFALEGVTSFSVQPLRLITGAGFFIAGLSFLYVCYSVLAWATGRTVPGWASTVLPIYLLGGLHLIALGVIGEYVGKIYQETKRRPRFIVDEIVQPEPGQERAGNDLQGTAAR